MIVASGRANTGKVLRWISRVANSKSKPEDFEAPGSAFLTLDAKIAQALFRKLSGELLRKVSIIERKKVKDRNKLLTGRTVLWYIYDSLRMNADLSLSYGLVDINNVLWQGDRHMEKFRNNWNDCVQNLAEPIDESHLASILLVQMQQSQKLKIAVDKWMPTLSITKRKPMDVFLT